MSAEQVNRQLAELSSLKTEAIASENYERAAEYKARGSVSPVSVKQPVMHQ